MNYKKLLKFLVVLVVLLFLTGCFACLDTFKYWNGAGGDNLVQTFPCEVEVVKIKEAIMFDYDSNIITKTGNEILDKIASIMKDNPEMKLYLTGYASVEGFEVYNQGLSQRRVDSVKVTLMDKGIIADRITTEAKGETDLFGELLENNRRVMILSID